MKEQKKLKPWQRHSSHFDVPWDQRAEQKFDSDKVIFRFNWPFSWSISLSGVTALSIFFVSILYIVL